MIVALRVRVFKLIIEYQDVFTNHKLICNALCKHPPKKTQITTNSQSENAKITSKAQEIPRLRDKNPNDVFYPNSTHPTHDYHNKNAQTNQVGIHRLQINVF